MELRDAVRSGSKKARDLMNCSSGQLCIAAHAGHIDVFTLTQLPGTTLDEADLVIEETLIELLFFHRSSG